MIQLVVGWVKNFFELPGKVEQFKPVETLTDSQSGYKFEHFETPTPSQRGYKFEHDELKRIMERLKGFETVELTDVYGTLLTPDSIDERFGKDGGIDCVIHIIAPTERGAKNVATRLRNIIVNGDY